MQWLIVFQHYLIIGIFLVSFLLICNCFILYKYVSLKGETGQVSVQLLASWANQHFLSLGKKGGLALWLSGLETQSHKDKIHFSSSVSWACREA